MSDWTLKQNKKVGSRCEFIHKTLRSENEMSDRKQRKEESVFSHTGLKTSSCVLDRLMEDQHKNTVNCCNLIYCKVNVGVAFVSSPAYFTPKTCLVPKVYFQCVICVFCGISVLTRAHIVLIGSYHGHGLEHKVWMSLGGHGGKLYFCIMWSTTSSQFHSINCTETSAE